MKILLTSLQLISLITEQTKIPFAKEFNFHLIPDGKNNYRSAQIPVVYKNTQLLSKVIDHFKIKTIIRLNGDTDSDARDQSNHPKTTSDQERKLAQSKGVTFKVFNARRNQKEIEELLNGGNVLIHCAHGADRTGGTVGGYLYNIGWGDAEKIWNYTTKFNRWNNMVKSGTFGDFLYLAQKFGVRDMEHAKQLASNSKPTEIKKSTNKKTDDKTNIIIGDSQVPYVDKNTTKASTISNTPGKSSLWEGGKTVSWLIGALKEYSINKNIKNVIIVIGTNGGFGKFATDDIPQLFKLLKEKFPNSKFYVVQGSWGWGGLKNIKEKEVRDYYSKYKSEGATIIEPPIGKIEPHGDNPVYKKIGESIDNLL